jgi:hypothetical protein
MMAIPKKTQTCGWYKCTHLIRYIRSYYYHWIDTTSGKLLIPESIIRPVLISISASALALALDIFIIDIDS